MSSNNDDSIADEGSPLLPMDSGSVGSGTEVEVPPGDAKPDTETALYSSSRPSMSPPTTSSAVSTGRILLLIVAFLYGSLSVSLRMVYARPGPPAASILSATRGWMTVVCLLPVIAYKSCKSKTRGGDPPVYSKASFYGFALELAVFNFGTQGLLNIGLLTTESARSAFFTQLSVVITPVLAATIGLCCRKKNNRVVVHSKVWIASLLALFGLYVLSSTPGQVELSDDVIDDTEESDTDSFSWNWASISLTVTSFLCLLSFGDWCCLGSAFCWSYYIYRLSDWGDRYDEAQTMFVKNIFMAILYTSWTVASYFWTTTTLRLSEGRSLSDFDIDSNSTDVWSSLNSTDIDIDIDSDWVIDDDGDVDSDGSGFYLWEGWRDPIALSILFYTALSSGAISDILQQKAQKHVPAAESNIVLSLEPVFAAVLGVFVLSEIPSERECVGGALIVIASVLASST